MSQLLERRQTQTEPELGPRFLVSPGDLAAGDISGLAKAITPESPGVIACDGLEIEIDLRASTGEQLPKVADQMAERQRLIRFGGAIGELAGKGEVSDVTGCWLDTSGWRDDKGYTYVRDPRPYGVDRDPFGIRAHKLAYILHQREADPSFQLEPHTPLDHLCRNTACCNPYHLVPTTPEENNRLARLAQAVENPLISGQTMLAPTSKNWIDGKISYGEDESDEETGVIVATRDGVYQLISSITKGIATIRGDKIKDERLEVLRPMSVRKAGRPSRARKPVIMKGQETLI